MKKYFLTLATVTLFAIGFAASDDSKSDIEMLQEEVSKMMVEKTKEKGKTLKISNFHLIHQDGNIYTGLATCTLDGEKVDLDVNVVYDGNNFQAEWAPTAEYQQKAWEDAWDQAEKDYDKAVKEAEEEANRAAQELEEEWNRTEREMSEEQDRLERDLEWELATQY